MNKKLYKSEDNKVLCGVCGGLGEFLGIDPTIIRLIWVVLAFAAGSGLLIYLLAAVIFREDHWTKICCFRSCIDMMMLQKK